MMTIMNDKQPGDLWEEIGSMDELELLQVLTTLFATYETAWRCEPENPEAQRFFKNLALAATQVSACNLNRR